MRERHAFQSAWMLTDNPSVLTPGRYLFTPPGTPHYPDWSHYGSRDWTTDDFAAGEQKRGESRTYRRKRFSGVGPNPYPDALRIGSAGEVAGDARLDHFCDWSFEAHDGATWSLPGPRIEFEDSFNCGGPNPGRQHGSAVALFVTSIPRQLTLVLHGRTELQDDNYDVGLVFLDDDLLLTLSGQEQGLGCAMGDVSATVTVVVQPGQHELFFSGDTVDGRYHVDAFFQLTAVFVPGFEEDTREWYGGFPLACYGLSPLGLTALLSIPDIFNPLDQLPLARIMDTLYTDPVQAANDLHGLMGAASVVSAVPNNTSLVPGSVVGTRPGLTICLIAGTSNVDQAATYSLFSLTGPTRFSDYSTNLVWRTAAVEIHARILANGADPTGRIILCGHSYGGAVAMLLCGDYLSFNPAREVDCLTWGAAKPGDQRLAELLRRARVMRLANEGDPVPGLPPWYSQILGYLAVLPPGLVSNWVQLTQPAGQVVLNEDGTVEYSERSTLSLTYLIVVVAAVLSSTPLILPFAHSMSAYVLRTENRIALPPVP